MALVVKDRVRETTTTTGTGTVTLGGAVSGFQSFSVIGNANTTYYTIVDAIAGSWEVGIGTYTSSGTTLARDTVLESSNAGSLVNFAVGTKDVFVTYPAERSVYVDGTAISPATAARLGFDNLAQGSALSVLGVTGNATANVDSVAAASDHQVLRRSGTAVGFGAVALNQTNAVTGTLPVANGGTGATTLTSNNVLLGNGTGALQSVAPSTLGNVLTSDGTAWTSSPSPASPEVKTPTNVSPANEATDIGETPTLTGSAFGSLYGFAKSAGQWQVSTVSDFSTTVVNTGDVAGTSVSYSVGSGILTASTTYYWRLRYKDENGVYSEYSTPTEFTTASSFPNLIPTPAATPAIGASFEGGFYTGLIWNQVTQSATSTAIGTGSKTFTVTDTEPLFYSGQAVEVRSRANPSTARMIGTITSAFGTTLTVNVSSVNGSGTLTDWSVMAKYRVIVAPKSSGESTGKSYKNVNTAAPSETGTLTEGLKATLAMVAAATSTVYPAAHYCNDLSIGSYTDWYLPARDELELIWRNLKPTTDNNYIVANRPTGATPDYKNLGSLGDTAATHGTNNNSSPQGAAYTTTVPARTSVSAFQTGGAEAIGSQIYWSSTEYNTTFALNQWYNASRPGGQHLGNKATSDYVRAVRRSII